LVAVVLNDISENPRLPTARAHHARRVTGAVATDASPTVVTG
jgi:hypothetical protein